MKPVRLILMIAVSCILQACSTVFDRRPQTLLPPPWRYGDLLPITRDPAKWKGRDDLQYRLRHSFDAGVNIDGACDCDLAIGRTGLIILSDLDTSHTVSVYSPTGALLQRVPMPQHPSGVALSPDGGILVASNFGPLQLLTPTNSKTMAYNIRSTDDVSTGINGMVYAIDSRNAEIVELRAPDIRTIAKLDSYQSGMKKICADACGRIVLADWSRQTICVYAQDGHLILNFKTRGEPWGAVISGRLVCYSTSQELVFVDLLENREVHSIQTTHRNAALALGPAGELVTIDEVTDQIHVYKTK